MLREFFGWVKRAFQGPPLMQLVRGMLGGSTVKSAYKDSPWVYRAIRYKADNISRLPLRMMEGVRGDSEATKVAVKHPFNLRLERPNPQQNGYEFEQTKIIQLESRGACFVVMPDRMPNEYPSIMFARGPDGFKRIKDTRGITVAWELSTGAKTMTLAPWEIVLLRYVDPDDPDGWLPPLEAARRGISASFAAEIWNEATYKNSGIPKGLLSSDRGVDPTTAKRLFAEWNDLYGGAANANKVALLTGGLKFTPVQSSARDMEWLKSQEWNRDLVFVVTGVWPEVFGFGSTTFNNRAEARRDVWESTLLPMLEWNELAFWSQLFWSVDQGRFWMEYDTSGVQDLQLDMSTRIDNSTKLWEKGVPWEQLNRRFTLGLEEFQGWDVSYLPSSVMTSSDVLLEGLSEDEPMTEDETEDALDFLGRGAERLERAAAGLVIEEAKPVALPAVDSRGTEYRTEPCAVDGMKERSPPIVGERQQILTVRYTTADGVEHTDEVPVSGFKFEPVESPAVIPTTADLRELHTDGCTVMNCEECNRGTALETSPIESETFSPAEYVGPEINADEIDCPCTLMESVHGDGCERCHPEPADEVMQENYPDPAEEASAIVMDALTSGVISALPSKKCTGTTPYFETNDSRAIKSSRGKGGRRYLREFKALEKRMASKLRRHFHEVRSALLKRMAELDDGERAVETVERITAIIEDALGEDRRAWLDEEETERAISKADAERLMREMFGDKKMTESLTACTRAIDRDSVRAGALQVVAEDSEDDEDSWKPSREQLAIIRKRGKKIVEIEETTRKKITAVLAKGVAEQDNLTGLQERVRAAFNATNARAITIARTEVGGAMNEARNDQYVREGVEYHEWVDSGDDHVRDSHKAVNSEVVKIGTPFSNGLLYPNDPAGPAEEVINCRCRTVAAEGPKKS